MAISGGGQEKNKTASESCWHVISHTLAQPDGQPSGLKVTLQSLMWCRCGKQHIFIRSAGVAHLFFCGF